MMWSYADSGNTGNTSLLLKLFHVELALLSVSNVFPKFRSATCQVFPVCFQLGKRVFPVLPLFWGLSPFSLCSYGSFGVSIFPMFPKNNIVSISLDKIEHS